MKRALQSRSDVLSRNFSIFILACLVLMAVFAPLLAPYSPSAQDLTNMRLPPLSEGHLLGTDNLGIDILSKLIYGSRVSLFVGLAGTCFGMVVGIVLGLIAGYYGGWIDTVIMRLGDIQLAFPFVLLALAIMGVLGPGVKNVYHLRNDHRLGEVCARYTCRRAQGKAVGIHYGGKGAWAFRFSHSQAGLCKLLFLRFGHGHA